MPWMSGEGELPQSLSMPQLHWWPFEWRWKFFLLPFSGMRITRDPALIPLVVWAGVVALVAGSLVRYQEGKRPSERSLSNWPQYRAHYHYIISRGLPTPLDRQLQATSALLAHSGEWRLYEVLHPKSGSATHP